MRLLTTAFRQVSTVEGESSQIHESIGPALCRCATVVLSRWGSSGIQSSLDISEPFRIEPAIDAAHSLEGLG